MKSILKIRLMNVLLGILLIGSTIYSCSASQGKEKDSELKQQINYELLAHEKLGRGLIAIPLETGKRVFWGEGSFDADAGKVYIGWRLLASDPKEITFNVYRQIENESMIKINESPIGNSTNFIDGEAPFGKKIFYTIKPVINGAEGTASELYPVEPLTGEEKSYKTIKLKGDYTFARVAIADLDGDGEYDYVIKYPGGNVDPWYLYWKPSPETFKLEAYKNNGEPLWDYDFGWAIEFGSWYSPYIVYDLNGDGKAEVIVKSGVSDPDPRNEEGKVESGPEYVTVLDGMTGTPIAQADWIPREPFYEVNERHAYNYASRNQLAVAYLDGVHPHIIVLRGTYNLQVVRAYRLIENELKLVWDWSNQNLPREYWGQGGHQTWAADVDNDGKDELILGSSILDDDGKEMWTTGFGHNDNAFVGDILPERPGLEIFYVIEAGRPEGNGICLVDAKSGEVIWGSDFPTNHVHGGFCSDIDRVHPGRECWGHEIAPFEGKRRDFAVLYNSKGEIIDRDYIPTRSVFWDTDNQRELLNNGEIYDYNGPTIHHSNIEGSVIAIGDFFGDWREEIITSVKGELRIYSTTILANSRHVTLMQDPIYRNNVAHGSNGYYQVPMTTNDIPFRSSK